MSVVILGSLLFAAAPPAQASASESPAEQLMSKLHWRNIGPFIGGRAVAVAGVAGRPNLFYMGGVQGGIWQTTDYGQHWTNISDGKLPGVASPIGSLAVAPSNPNVIYAGTGEADIRSDFDTGDGVYKSTDSGKTWIYAGLRDTHMTTKLVVDPRNPNIVYAASLGHVFKPNPERGVFKTTDGGRTWRKILFVDDNTGGVDLAMDSRDSRILYAATWQAQRVPWKLTSGGPGSALYKTVNGGTSWSKISSHPGFARAPLGKIGVSVAASNPRIVYSIVQAHDGGVFRSNDGGATWRRVNAEMKLRQRAFYYTAIFVDPTNPQIAYVPNVDGVFRTKDGGKTFAEIDLPHGDNHIVWINPRNPKILLVGNDGGGTVSVDWGEHWSSERNQPTGQYYHVALDDQFPFHVFGAAQDEGSFEGPSAALGGGIDESEWHSVALGESTFVAPQPGSPFVTYGSGYYSAFVRFDRITGDAKNVSPWPRYMPGAAAGETKYRFGWTHPIFFSPSDPHELLAAAQVVFSSTDHGQTWTAISPDLTRNDPSTEGPSGGPVDYDQTGAETFPDIASLAASPLDSKILWAGSADGLVHVTTDHGAHWTAITPPQLPQWAQISSIEPSHTDKGTAYLSAS
ncbi:MAG: glycosyl hydrolase, partial [Candidatus Eremiobacteraeota bacterium]|nr:glycosyl hydrolase [Candidatus Eremiobacteraeota bacterium]